MSFISRVLGGKNPSTSEESRPSPAECSHATLTPRWSAPEEMGQEDRVTSYHCERCGAQVTPAEANRRRGARG